MKTEIAALIEQAEKEAQSALDSAFRFAGNGLQAKAATQREAARIHHEYARKLKSLASHVVCSDCQSVAQQLLGSRYEDLARKGHSYLPQAVEWLRADYDMLARKSEAEAARREDDPT